MLMTISQTYRSIKLTTQHDIVTFKYLLLKRCFDSFEELRIFRFNTRQYRSIKLTTQHGIVTFKYLLLKRCFDSFEELRIFRFNTRQLLAGACVTPSSMTKYFGSRLCYNLVIDTSVGTLHCGHFNY
jgi:hypothetical protein